MLNNLKAEYARKGIKPNMGIMKALGCSEKTARNKLSEIHPVTIPEALKIRDANFKEDDFTLEYLFASDEQKTA